MFENPQNAMMVLIVAIPLIIVAIFLQEYLSALRVDSKRQRLTLEDKQLVKLNKLWHMLSGKILQSMYNDHRISSQQRRAIKAIVDSIKPGETPNVDSLSALCSYYGVADTLRKMVIELITSKFNGVTFENLMEAVWHIRYYSVGSKQLSVMCRKGEHEEFVGILNNIERSGCITNEQIARLYQIVGLVSE